MGNGGKLEGDYRWLAWAEDKKGASCCLTLKGRGENVGEVSFDGCPLVGLGKWKKCFFQVFDCGEDGVESVCVLCLQARAAVRLPKV